jgi:hypothetical protein
MRTEVQRPLSPAERWYWIADQISLLNVIARVRLTGHISGDVLDRAAAALLRRCLDEGVTVHGALAAAMASVIGPAVAQKASGRVCIGSPMDFRADLNPVVSADEVGSYVNTVPSLVRFGVDRDLWSIARQINRSLTGAGVSHSTSPCCGNCVSSAPCRWPRARGRLGSSNATAHSMSVSRTSVVTTSQRESATGRCPAPSSSPANRQLAISSRPSIPATTNGSGTSRTPTAWCPTGPPSDSLTAASIPCSALSPKEEGNR